MAKYPNTVYSTPDIAEPTGKPSHGTAAFDLLRRLAGQARVGPRARDRTHRHCGVDHAARNLLEDLGLVTLVAIDLD